MKAEDEARAREIFFSHDGSTFAMSRNGTDEEYRSFNVAPTLGAAWLAQLTDQKIAALDEPGNWWSLRFLLEQQDFTRADIVLTAIPLGNGWEQASFIEHYLTYIHEAVAHGAVSGPQAELAERSAVASAQQIAAESRSRRVRERATRIAHSDKSDG